LELPDFLKVSVERGLIDEQIARRIELFRRTRGLGESALVSTLLTSNVDAHLTFDNFVQCKENSFAFELAMNVARKPPLELPYNPLYIYADVGLGKTHILSAIANACAPRVAIMVNTADLEAEFAGFNATNLRMVLREWICSGDILLVDDIQLCEGNEDLQTEFFSVINHMFVKGGWVVISSDVPPTHLSRIESRLISRLGSGAVVSLQMGDHAHRLALLRQFFGTRGAPEDVLEFLAEKVRTNIRALKAAVAQLSATSDVTGEEITLDLARSLLLFPEDTRRPTPTDARGAALPLPGEDEDSGKVVVRRFREMLDSAENEEEQSLALQIALGERIRQLRETHANPKRVERFIKALELVRGGDVKGAIEWLSH
jgi:chromosomal replication initiator protein DnaA